MQRFLIALLVLVSFRGQFVQAQMGLGKPEEILAVRERPLIVVLEEPNDHVLKKLEKKKKTDLIPQYEADVATFNAAVKAAVELVYPYKENGIQYMTYPQVRSMSLDDNETYAVLRVATVLTDEGEAKKVLSGSDDRTNMTGVNWDYSTVRAGEDLDFKASYTWMAIYLIEDMTSTTSIMTLKNNPVGFATLSETFPSEASLIHGLSTIMDYMDYRIEKEEGGQKVKWKTYDDYVAGDRAPELKEMTLLIRETDLSPEVNPRTLKVLYPYPIQVCTAEEMNAALLEQRPDVAYLMIIGTWAEDMIAYFTYVSRAEDNKVVSVVRPKLSGMIGASYLGALSGGVKRAKAGDEVVTREVLQEIRLQVEGKGKK